MVPLLDISLAGDRERVGLLLRQLRLNPADLISLQGSLSDHVASVRKIIADVAQRGDAALVDLARKFDDPKFAQADLRVSANEMATASGRVPPEQLAAVRRSINQVREYQSHILPKNPPDLQRAGASLGLRFTPLDSVGLMVPGGKAAYPSSLIMLAVPAQVAGVKKITVCTPPSKYGRSDLMLAAYHELGLTEVYRAGGAGAIAAMAIGTATIPAVDKIVGPGNIFVQLAKRELAGIVGIDGFLGPSEILILADDSANPAFIAADMLAQAEHDPGSCFLLTDSRRLAEAVSTELDRQSKSLSRLAAITKALEQSSAIIVSSSMQDLIDLANRFAAEHVSIQTRNDETVLALLTNAGAIFLGPYSPVAAGDYLAGPSHCLPTNTTARFTSGVSVYEFLKRSSVVRYTREALSADAPSIIALANSEHLDAHAASVNLRMPDQRR